MTPFVFSMRTWGVPFLSIGACSCIPFVCLSPFFVLVLVKAYHLFAYQIMMMMVMVMMMMITIIITIMIIIVIR